MARGTANEEDEIKERKKKIMQKKKRKQIAKRMRKKGWELKGGRFM